MSVANHRCAFRPVRGGTLIVLPDNNSEAGTLGMVLTDGVDQWLLTCHHVLSRPSSVLVQSDRVFQPNGTSGVIATLAGVIADVALDCAAVKLLAAASDEVIGIGQLSASVLPVVGMRVIKSGWKTGVSEGRIAQVAGNDVIIERLPGYPLDYLLAAPGDSGSVWVESASLAPVALHTRESAVGPGLPRVSDGSLLFLLHLISKMRPAKDGGSRFGIVLNGSPLFTGGAGSGESEIRRYVLENDLVEAIIGLPPDMFYNTGISTYVWIVSNRKPEHRKGKLQLIDASSFWQKMRKSLGSKRKELGPEHIETITRLFGDCQEVNTDGVPISRIFENEDFGYRTITVERPERDAAGSVVKATKGKLKGKPQPDANLRDTENVPLSEDVETYFKREVLPHAPDAWVDHEKTKVGYEIPFNRHFYVFRPPRELAKIDADLKVATDRILTMIAELSK